MNRVKKLAVISIAVAMAVVLDYIKELIPFLNMPSGGSINIALLPIVFVSFIFSYKEGIITGFLWWAISSLLGFNNWYLNVGQYLCDYILPSIIPGMSSLFYSKFKDHVKCSDSVLETMGIVSSFAIRSFVLIFSGAAFWPSNGATFSKPAWIFSIGYNLPYNIVTAILLCAIVPLLINRLRHIVLK